MRFDINNDLLKQSRATLFGREKIYWIVGGAGSGKTTICQALSVKFDIDVYDMDAHIYGTYHSRFTQENHPVNQAWSTSQDRLAWLLDMSWDDFNNFNQAAFPEYLTLLSEDIDATPPNTRLLIDGGVCNPSILAQVISTHQIVCLVNSEQSSAGIWGETDERKSMQEIIFQLPKPKEAWRKFLEFDSKITHIILNECLENNIAVLSRDRTESVDELTEKIANVLGIH